MNAANSMRKTMGALVMILVLALLGLTTAPASAAAKAKAAKAAQAGDGALVIKADRQDPVLNFASEELEHWIKADRKAPATSLGFQLKVDPTLKPFTFAISSRPTAGGRTVILSGATSNETLQAAYTALEAMGYRFFISGPIIPGALNLKALPTQKKVYAPTVQRRGIRQHINFPMDISGYPLEEAKEYVRNLARLRYNWITFHSYPGHWDWDKYSNAATFGVYNDWVNKRFKPKGDDLTNGAFFYGDHFQIPNYAPVKDKIRFNKAIYCAPEVESVYYTINERSAVMTHWLAEVMKECQRAGMKVQFSTEIRLCDDQYNLGLVDRILKDYPMIDALEFITREGGEEIKGDYDAYFARQKTLMDEILNAPDGNAIDKKYRVESEGLDKQVKDLAYDLRLINALRKSGWMKRHPKIQLVTGNYVTEPGKQLQMVCQLASRYVPQDVWYSIMPGHSSRKVADQFAASGIDKDLLARTMLYSWIEFDGYMFLQQLAGTGVYKAIDDEQKVLGAGQPVFGILYNQWRTGENFLSFRYTALASLDKPAPQDFWADYARSAGIQDVAKFVADMGTIDALSDQRAIAGNIGFCIKGTWTIERRERGVACLWWWGKKEVETAAEKFLQVSKDLQANPGDVQNPQYGQQLELLINRCQAAYCHLKAVRLMQDALIRFNRETRAMPTDLTAAEKATIVKICDEADRYVQQYMKLVGAQMIDRGVEGFLINYYYGPPMMVHNFKALYGGQGEYIDVDTDHDTVPLPLTSNETKLGVQADVKGN